LLDKDFRLYDLLRRLLLFALDCVQFCLDLVPNFILVNFALPQDIDLGVDLPLKLADRAEMY